MLKHAHLKLALLLAAAMPFGVVAPTSLALLLTATLFAARLFAQTSNTFLMGPL
jgi:hypothetical protein